MTDPGLPEAFANLEPFLDWALESEHDRTDRRVTSSMDDMRAFYDAMMSHIDEVLDHLDRNWGEDMPAAERRLYLLALSLVEVSTLVELHGQREPGEHATRGVLSRSDVVKAHRQVERHRDIQHPRGLDGRAGVRSMGARRLYAIPVRSRNSRTIAAQCAGCSNWRL